MALYERIMEAAEYIKDKAGEIQIGLVLGSAQGSLIDYIQNAVELDYKDIPNFQISTAPAHAGKLIIGDFGGKRVACMGGRLHCYEGYAASDTVFPIQVMKFIGAHTVILTNAAGGINESFKGGDLMLITDHINLTGRNPLAGENDDRVGVRFPDMSAAYTPALCELARECAQDLRIELEEGVYLGCLGPNFETPAEIRAFRTLGADAVGMSTVLEVVAAAHCGLNVLGISMITNMAAGVQEEPLSGDEVIEIGRKKAAQSVMLLHRIITKI